ncbi:MAG: histidine phosphatase family protein [Pseudomonadota bacterium]
MRELFIVRHGETEWNLQSRMQGRLDSALTDTGREHARLNGQLLKQLGPVDQLCVSPAGRTMETAFIINSQIHSHIEYFDELQERDCGEWSGFTIEEISQQFPQAWRAREEDPFMFRPPGGENMQDMLERVYTLLEDLYVSSFHTVALVTHGVMSKVILKYFLDLAELQSSRVRHPNNLVYRLTFNAQDIETHHFLDGGEAQQGLLYQDAEPIIHETT